jgi:hypothetical protein
MPLLILSIIITLATAGFLLARGSGAFAYGLSRVVAMISGFVEFKAALRGVRAAGARRSGGGRLAYKASYSQAR